MLEYFSYNTSNPNDFIRIVYLHCQGYGCNAITYLHFDSVDVNLDGLKINASGLQPFPQTLCRSTQCPADANMKTRRHIDIIRWCGTAHGR